jgi:hypothetical protein
VCVRVCVCLCVREHTCASEHACVQRVCVCHSAEQLARTDERRRERERVEQRNTTPKRHSVPTARTTACRVVSTRSVLVSARSGRDSRGVLRACTAGMRRVCMEGVSCTLDSRTDRPTAAAAG